MINDTHLLDQDKRPIKNPQFKKLSNLQSLKKFIYAWMKDWFKNEDMLKSLNFYG